MGGGAGHGGLCGGGSSHSVPGANVHSSGRSAPSRPTRDERRAQRRVRDATEDMMVEDGIMRPTLGYRMRLIWRLLRYWLTAE